LVTYNQEDCLALKVLVDELSNIKESAQKLSHVDFIDQPKRLATQANEQIHSRFEAILKFAHADYEGKKIRIRSDDMEESTHSNGRRGYASHQGYTIPNYSPEGSPDFPDFHLYGHGLQAWAVYQRLVMCLPYRLITQAMEDLFYVHISGAIIVDFLNGFLGTMQIPSDCLFSTC
jgi:hypothetical protein